MAINTSLLIAAPMLQDYFVDNANGEAMSAGVITCYQDNSRTTLKNWYYQSGTPGNYAYIALPNPLTLSAVGTITDANGNDTIPFFYPYSENDNQTFQSYYITVFDSDGQQQFTRQNFPFVSQVTPNPNQEPTFDNYIINNRFWRNIGVLNAQNVSAAVLAPSQHDGFSSPDIQYIKSTTGATETITFSSFALGLDPLVGDITPEFYINHDCTGAQLGETQKVYQFPISLHVQTLESVQATITLQAQNVGGNVNNTITLYIYQYLGTGVSSPSPIFIQDLTLTSAWQKFVIPFTFPSAEGATLGKGNDDALYLQIGMPLAETCNINFTLPSVYLSSNVPTNDFATYDQIDAIINSPRTGDTRISLNSFQPFGWIAANEGTLGSAASIATLRANGDTWPLYNLIWNNVLNNWAPVSGGRGASAIADFTANKTITLTKTLGRVAAGLNPQLNTPIVFTTNYGASHFNLTVTGNGTLFPTGAPVQLTNTGGALPASLAINTVYYAISINANTIQLATTLDNANANIAIDIGNDQTGTSKALNALGATFGESMHVLTTPEMPAHVHAIPNFGVSNAAGGAGVNAASAGSQSTGTTGGGGPHNIMQPTTFLNVFFKL